MKKIHMLKKNEDFNRIINTIKPFRTKYYNIFVEKTDSNKFYFGIVASKKLGNAVSRNKIKRRIKDILDEKKYAPGFNCIVMAKGGVETENFEIIRNDLLSNLEKFNIFLN